MNEVRILTKKEAAKHLGIHPETLTSWVASGKASRLAGTLPGSPIKFCVEHIEKLKKSLKDKA